MGELENNVQQIINNVIREVALSNNYKFKDKKPEYVNIFNISEFGKNWYNKTLSGINEETGELNYINSNSGKALTCAPIPISYFPNKNYLSVDIIDNVSLIDYLFIHLITYNSEQNTYSNTTLTHATTYTNIIYKLPKNITSISFTLQLKKNFLLYTSEEVYNIFNGINFYYINTDYNFSKNNQEYIKISPYILPNNKIINNSNKNGIAYNFSTDSNKHYSLVIIPCKDFYKIEILNSLYNDNKCYVFYFDKDFNVIELKRTYHTNYVPENACYIYITLLYDENINHTETESILEYFNSVTFLGYFKNNVKLYTIQENINFIYGYAGTLSSIYEANSRLSIASNIIETGDYGAVVNLNILNCSELDKSNNSNWYYIYFIDDTPYSYYKQYLLLDNYNHTIYLDPNTQYRIAIGEFSSLEEFNTYITINVLNSNKFQNSYNMPNTTPIGIIRKDRFTIPVNCNNFLEHDTSVTLQDNYNEYLDDALVILPASYSDGGTKTRLIISCHGAGGTVTTDDSQVEQQDITKYFVANGYAIADCNGLPKNYATQMGINIMNNVGSPIAIQSYIKLYHYCMEHYNFYPEVFCYGASMGGISSTNLVMSGCIPILAHAAACPVLDTYNEIWLNPWSNGLPKTALKKFYGLNDDDTQELIENKTAGFNPVKNKTIILNNEPYTFYPCPVKFFQCSIDRTVNCNITVAFIEACKRGGSIAEMRVFTDGVQSSDHHEPQRVGSAISNPSGNVIYNGTTISVKPMMEEVFLWYKRFDNN